MDEIITLDYGSGGKKTSRLIEQYILPGFSNPALDVLGDGALIPGSGTLAFSTDSFVVDPIFFPGLRNGERHRHVRRGAEVSKLRADHRGRPPDADA